MDETGVNIIHLVRLVEERRELPHWRTDLDPRIVCLKPVDGDACNGDDAVLCCERRIILAAHERGNRIHACLVSVELGARGNSVRFAVVLGLGDEELHLLRRVADRTFSYRWLAHIRCMSRASTQKGYC